VINMSIFSDKHLEYFSDKHEYSVINMSIRVINMSISVINMSVSLEYFGLSHETNRVRI
jgi:hypothetical protein